MRETNNGFIISEKDLKLRGAGEVLGTKQSGEQNFKILDMNMHENLIKIADKEAKIIVNKNPYLTGDYGNNLRTLLCLFDQKYYQKVQISNLEFQSSNFKFWIW